MKKIKVSYLGLNSLFGRITTNLLKQSPCIHKLTLYDESSPSHAIEHPNVFFGRDSLQDAIKDVNIVVIGDEGGALQEEDRIRAIGPKVIRYTEAIIKFSPNAIVIVAASPLNILFPMIGNCLGIDWQDRLLGTTSVDTLRASRALDGLLNDPQGRTHILPVIGGNSYSTRVPLFSHVCPRIAVSNDIRDRILKKMKLFDGSDSQDMDAIERAYSTVRFIHSVLTGMTRDTSVPEIAMTKTSMIPQTDYFSLPILIGRKGIERAADLPKMDETEEKLFLNAALKLSEQSQKAAILSKQFTDQNEAEDLKMNNVLKLHNNNFREVESRKFNGESQLKKTEKDPFPYPRQVGRSKRRQNFSKKRFLGLPCASKAPAKSPEINKSCANGHKKESWHNGVETEANILKEENVSEYSEILSKDASDHLMSLNFGLAEIRQRPNLTDENTDDEFTDTLQFEVEEHLNSLKHKKLLHNLSSQRENEVSGVDAEGENEQESRGTSEQYIVSSSDNNELDGLKSSVTTKITPTIPLIRKKNKAIMVSKPIKSESAESTEAPSVSSTSPPVKIYSDVADSSIISPVNDSNIGLDMSKQEDKDAKKELRPDGSPVEKSISDSLSGANIDDKKQPPAEVLNPEQQLTGDANRDFWFSGAAHKDSSKSNVNQAIPKPAKKELNPRDVEFADDTAKAHTASQMYSPNGKKVLRTQNHSDFSSVMVEKYSNVGNSSGSKKEVQHRESGRTGVNQNIRQDKYDAKKELRPRGESAVSSGLPNSNQNIKRQTGIKVRASKVRGKVNAQVLNAFEADRSSGDQMSKSQIMMLNRKQKNEEKASNDKPQRMVGEAGDAATPFDSHNYELNLDVAAAAHYSVAKSGREKTRSARRIGRRAVPFRKSSDNRNQVKNKMGFRERKLKAQEEDGKSTKENYTTSVPAEYTSETVKTVSNVSTNTTKRINTAITDMRERTPKRRKESGKSSHYNPKPPTISDKTVESVPDAPSGSLTSKRIDSAIKDAKPLTRQRSPSPKVVDFKPSHKQPDVSSHLLTDAVRVAKLNSLHKINSDEFNIEKTVDNSNVRFEPDFKVDVNKNRQRGESKKQANKPPSMKPKSQKSDEPTTPRNVSEDAEDHRNLIENDKDLTSDKTMNYFMRERKKGQIELNDSESRDVTKVEPKPKKRQLGSSTGKSDKRKKHKRPEDHANKNKPDTQQNNMHSLIYSNKSNQAEKVKPKKDNTEKENDQEPEDPWDSKYFTKASEMFFKMFRDSVTCTVPKFIESCDSPKSNSHKCQDLFLGQPQKHQMEMKADAFQSEQCHKNEASGAHSNPKLESQSHTLKNTSESSNLTKGTSSKLNFDESSKQRETHRKTSPGKINFRPDKRADVKCKMHPEASTRTSDMCGNITFHANTGKAQQNVKESPEDMPKNSKELSMNFDKLYEESSTVPTIIGAKGDKSWKSVETGEKGRDDFVPSEVLRGVVATSDKGRGDAINKVDFTVCRMPDQIRMDGHQKKGETIKRKYSSDEGSRGLKASPTKIPIKSKTIKQVSIPYQMEVVPSKSDDVHRTEKSYKWERIVNVFKNIIISDIEDARPRFILENTPAVKTISTSSIAKPVPPPPKKLEVAPQEAKRGVFTVTSKSKHLKKGKYETAKKKRSSESKKGHIIKNNPKKIVNYFSKRGASASSYEKPRFDGHCYDQSEGLMSQTSAKMGQNSASFALPSKIK